MTEKTETAGSFDALIDEMNVLAKSMPACEGDTLEDDKKIKDAAAEGAAEGETGKDGEAKEVLGKSFKVTLEDGSIEDAVDGTELVKSLMDRVEAGETFSKTFAEQALGVIKGHADLIKSLRDDVAALKNRGVGRKAILTVTEKPAATETTLAKSEAEGMTSEDFLAKCLSLQGEGKLTGQDVASAEARINRNLQPPEHVVKTVLASIRA